MATRIFPWGTVRGKTNSMVLSFTGGKKFELPFADADWVAQHFYALGAPSYKWGFKDPNSVHVRLEWNPSMTRPTARSVFKIGYSSKTFNGFASGTTPVILNYDEAMELAVAIRFVMKSAQTQTATATP